MLSFTVLGQDCGFEAEKFRQLSTATYGRGHQLYMGVAISSVAELCAMKCYTFVSFIFMMQESLFPPFPQGTSLNWDLGTIWVQWTLIIQLEVIWPLWQVVLSCWKYPSRDWYTIGLKARTGPANCAKKLSPTQLHHYQLGNCILALLHQAQCRSWDAAE